MSITLDDRDLTYGGSWFPSGRALYEYDNTSMGTDTAGSIAFIDFTGVSISVFGTIGPSNYGSGAPVSSYQIDSQPAVIFTAPVQGDTLYHYNFFTSSTLGNGPHQLIITNVNQTSYLWLDYIQYTPLSATSSSSSSSSSTSSSSTNAQQPITITTSSPSPSLSAPESQTNPSSSSSSWTLATSSSLSSPNTQQQTTRSSSTAPGTQTDPSSSSSSSPVPQTSVQTTDKNYASVIGGVVGGVVLVVVALALIYYLRRRRDTRAPVEERNVDDAHRNPAEASVSEVRSNDNFSLMSSAPLVRPSDWPHSKRSQHSSVVSPSVAGIRSMSYAEDLEADTFLPRRMVSGEQIYLHEDGGVRVAGGRLREQAEDIPPEYREYD